MPEKCPKCGKEDLTITYNESNVYEVSQIDGDFVDLGEPVDSYNSDLCRIYCEDCEEDWDSLVAFNEAKEHKS